MSTSHRMPEPPPDIPRALVFILALAAVCASQRPPAGVDWKAGGVDEWLSSLLELLALEHGAVPDDVTPNEVAKMAEERNSWSAKDQEALARALVQAALAPRKHKSGKDEPQVVYTPVARAAAHSTLSLLGLDAGTLLPRAEASLAATLAAAVGDTNAVDKARDKQKDGWGGALGRGLGGVIAGGVLLGVTGGLAAPALAALLAPLGLGAVLSATAAPIILGTLFGVTGGGLAGRRVSQRWRGVDEFSFIEIGADTKPTKEELDDVKARQGAVKEDMGVDDEGGELLFEAPDGDEDHKAAMREVARSRKELEERLAELSLNAGTAEKEALPSPPPTPPEGKEDVLARVKEKTPSLTATIVVPGLLTVSGFEALTAWRALCSPQATIPYATREKTKVEQPADRTGLKDGRDVYLLRFETEVMLSTGREVTNWVFTKIKSMAGTEIIKKTVLSAYYMAIALPLSVYNLSTMALDNSWMGAQNKAIKAGKLLGEVLAQRVQGERPVVLVGTSLGALTVMHALQHLAAEGETSIVESVYLVSLPSAPTAEEWAAARSVTARRLVNAWTGSDFVLASVVRLHEVVSRGVTLNSGVCVAGLGPVEQPGVEDVDLGDVLNGHSEINAHAGEILSVLEVDE